MKKWLLCISLLALTLPVHASSGGLRITRTVNITSEGKALDSRFPAKAIWGQDGRLYFLYSATSGVEPSRVLIFDSSGHKQGEFTCEKMSGDEIAVDVDGTIYYPSWGSKLVDNVRPIVVRVLDPDFKLRQTIQTPGISIYEIRLTRDRLYLIGDSREFDRRLIRVYTKDGTFMNSFAQWDWNEPSNPLVVINEKRGEVILCPRETFAPEVYDLDGHLKRKAPALLKTPEEVLPNNGHAVHGLDLLRDQPIALVSRWNPNRFCVEILDAEVTKIVREVEPPRLSWFIGINKEGDFTFIKRRGDELELINARLDD